jgi:FAD synthase
MHTRKHTKLIHEGKYVAEVEIEIIDSEEGWSPYISLEDALKLDEIRDALRKNDLERAKKLGKIYILKPVAA